MKKKYWLIAGNVIIILIALIIFFYPRDCGSWSTAEGAIDKDCDCMGIKYSPPLTGGASITCFGFPTAYYIQPPIYRTNNTLKQYDIEKIIYIVTAVCKNSTPNQLYEWVNFTVQNSGTATIMPGELGASIDGVDISSNTTNGTALINRVILTPGNIMYFSAIAQKNAKSTRTLTVSAPAGDFNYTLTDCPTWKNNP